MGAFKSWQILGKMCDELEEEGKNRGGEGKGEEQSELGWTKGLCTSTFSTGSWYDPVLKVLEGPRTDNILPPLTLVPVRGTNRD